MEDRKSTRLNSSHVSTSYAVFCETPRPPATTLFPYTTLFRSSGVTDSMKSSLIMIGVAKPQAPRHSTSITVKRPSGDVCPSSRQFVCLRNASTTASAPHTLHGRSEEHTSELQSRFDLVCRLLRDTPPTRDHPLSLHDALPIFRRHRLDEILIDHDRRRKAAGAEAFDFDHCEAAVGRRLPELETIRMFEKRIDHRLRAAHVAWKIGRAHV